MLSDRFTANIVAVIWLLAAGLPPLGCGSEDYAEIERARDSAVAPPPMYDARPLEGSAEALREILARPYSLQRTAALAATLDSLPPESLMDVQLAYQSVVLDLGDVEFVLLAEWWAGFDPKGALEWTRAEWKGDHPRVIQQIFRVWGREDPRPAAEAARALGGSDIGDVYLSYALAGWMESGEPGILAFVANLPSGAIQQRSLAVVARQMVMREGPDAATDWVVNLPQVRGPYKKHAMRRVAKAVALIDPEKAAAFAGSYTKSEGISHLAARVGRVWALHDPEATMAWLSTLPPGRSLTLATKESFGTWWNRDQEAALRWISGVKLEAPLDGAVAVTAEGLGAADALQGLEWAARISDPTTRWTTTGHIARWWFVREPEAAREWVDSQPDIPDMYRTKIFSVPPGLRRRIERHDAAESG